MFKKYFLIIFFLIFPSHAGFFELEIEALLMVMKNKEIISTKKYNESFKYRAIPIDKCRCLVKLREVIITKTFEVNVCNKKITLLKT